MTTFVIVVSPGISYNCSRHRFDRGEKMQGDEDRSDSAQSLAWRAHGRRPVRRRGTVALIAAMAAVAFGLSACGGGSTNSPGVAAMPSTTTTQPEAAGGGPPTAREWRAVATPRRRAFCRRRGDEAARGYVSA